MKCQLFIIHPSEIIRLGFVSLFRTYYNHEVLQFESFADIPYTLTEQETEKVIFFDMNFIVNAKIPDTYKFNIDTKLICISMTEDVNSYHSCHETITINSHKEEIINLIDRFFEKKETKSSVNGNNILSIREKEVLKYIALGKSNKDIADIIHVSTHTVISHRKNLIEKIGIKSVAGLTVYAILNKIIDMSEINN
jgi:DNA-binding CsgD family transcriptional regulator